MATINELKIALTKNIADVTVTISSQLTMTVTAKDLYRALPVEMYTISGVNLRRSPGLSGVFVQTIPFKSKVTVYGVSAITADGYNWVNVEYGDSIGWCVGNFLSSVTPVPTPTIQSTAGFGLHVLPGGSGNEALNMAQRLFNAGKPLACATVVNDIGLANNMARFVKYVIYRDVTGDGNPDNPQDSDLSNGNSGYSWMARLFPRYEGLDSRVYIQPANECSWFPQNNQFWIDAMRYAEQKGRKLAIFADAVGNPPDTPASTAIQKWLTRTDALRRAKANGHIVALHVYSAPGTPPGSLSADNLRPYYEARFIEYYKALPENAKATLVFTEAACEYERGRFQGIDNAVKWATAFYKLIKPYPFVAGMCLWTVGGNGWQDASIDSALPALETLFQRGL